jgi:hypothetical protein
MPWDPTIVYKIGLWAPDLMRKIPVLYEIKNFVYNIKLRALSRTPGKTHIENSRKTLGPSPEL